MAQRQAREGAKILPVVGKWQAAPISAIFEPYNTAVRTVKEFVGRLR
jgi:hypothetical protein